MQESSISTQELIRKGILTSNPSRAHQQCEVTTLGEDNNKNRKRNPDIVRKTQIRGKKARKLSKKKSWLEKLQETTETRWKTSQTRTSQDASSRDLNLARIAGSRRMGLRPSEDI